MKGYNQEFNRRFNLLSRVEKDLLKVLATCYEAVSASNFHKILKSANIYNSTGRSLTLREVERLVYHLNDKQWLQAESMSNIFCHEEHEKLLLQAASEDNRFPLFVMAIREVLPAKDRSWMRKPRNFQVCIRELQIAILQKQEAQFKTWVETINQYYPDQLTATNALAYLFEDPFDPALIQSFPEDFQHIALENIVFSNINLLKSIDDYIDYLKSHPQIEENTNLGKRYRALLGNIYIFKGKTKGNDIYFKNYARMAWVAYLMGDNEDAIGLFEKALASLQKATGKKNIYFYQAAGPFYLLALLKRGKKADYNLVAQYSQLAKGGRFGNCYNYINALIAHLQNDYSTAEVLLATPAHSSFDRVIKGMVKYWMGEAHSATEIDNLRSLYEKAKSADYQWFQMEVAALLAEIETDASKINRYESVAQQLSQRTHFKSIIHTIKVVEKWERALDALTTISPSNQVESADKLTRLVWLVDIENEIIQPKEQTRTKGGKWSKGRNIALKRLIQADLECMSPQDHRLASEIKTSSYGYYGATEYEFNFKEAIQKMTGHPYLFRYDMPSIPIEIIEKKPELLIDEKEEHFEFYFAYPIQHQGIQIIRETPTRYILLDILPEHEQVADIIGRRLKAPKEAKEQVLDAISNVTGLIEVQSTVFGDDEEVVQIEGDATIHAHLLPFGDGFKLEFFTKPLPSNPPYFKPGIGRPVFVKNIAGKKTAIQRNLEREQENLNIVKSGCPTLEMTQAIDGEYTFEEVNTCLNILLELEPLKGEGKVIIEWPKGEKVKLANTIGLDQLSMRIQRDNDWFGVSGQLQIQDDMVMDMRHLLDLMELNKNQQYIEVSDGQFVALTENFRARLAELNTLLDKRGRQMQLNPLAALSIEDWSEELGALEVDAKWKSHIKRIKNIRTVKPEVPASFKATLRPYQLEGYHWLCQLADWGVGACLADDMGLGKTIQALAVLVARGEQGPALVVAPASVSSNWRKEIEKFAPSLTAIPFGPGNRRMTIHQLQENDVLICSYGLLQQASDLLQDKLFSTIILDEAQAIKNRTAKRSRAAMELQGQFKIITTGTPIENHLGEFWNLFNFLNPGLLGSLKSFQEKFALPIEKNKDPFARESLKRLIQPFILRRRKDEVLKDLPSKTEITLSVTLSQEEVAFYEALRQRAVDNLANSEERGPQKRFQILAEITRLRQACCHPKLITSSVSIDSSKLQLLDEVLGELLANGHKALIFSQFVGHLKIIEQHLQKEQIIYQYLDGSTPLKKRESRIDAFQAGEGDVFLISLKAGGVGLNLTAADYVIHMDPWWNPAVEDQASDRAHRIGQTRPVTIYRLITENTIEEKIVRLHEHKRDLADSLLEGTDSSGKLSADELLELIKGG